MSKASEFRNHLRRGRRETRRRWLPGGRPALWLGFTAVLVPLTLLVILQFRWLMDLERNSTVARRVTLENYLAFITENVELYYSKVAAVTLNIPDSVFEKNPQKARYYFQNMKETEPAKLLFVMSLVGDNGGLTLFFDPKNGASPIDPEIDPTYWRILGKAGTFVGNNTFTVDERDPENPVILNPVKNADSQLVGFAGMVVDGDHFKRTLLPKMIKKSLKNEKMDEVFSVSVRNHEGREIFNPDLENSHENEVKRHFSFVFSQWEIGLRSRHRTPEQWARTQFVLNTTLFSALALVLVGGLWWALRTASRELMLSEMKSDFVSNVSHELRTPIASIRAFGELLRRGRTADRTKVREYGEYIETESRRLNRLIDNILDFSQIESGRKRYHMEDACLEEVVAGVLKGFEIRFRKRAMVFSLEKPEQGLPPVRIDQDAISQALANLLDNAVKYSNGGKEIAVGIKRRGGEVQLWVKDRGIGISKEEQERIFERFHRVGTGLVHDVKGSGLGLSIVKHIVLAHGGRVSVQSQPGKGSLFTIHLPLSDEVPDGTSQERETVSGPAPGKDTALGR